MLMLQQAAYRDWALERVLVGLISVQPTDLQQQQQQQQGHTR